VNALLQSRRILNPGSNERRGSGSVDLVVSVLGSDYDAVFADVVASVANDEHFRSGHGAEGLIAVCVAECDDCASSAFSNGQCISNQELLGLGSFFEDYLPAFTRAAWAAVSLWVAVCTS
jgi:hypothetical protein